MNTTISDNIWSLWAILKRPPLGIILFLVILSCVFLGLKIDRDVIVFIHNNPQYFYIDTFEIITKLGDATGWLLVAAFCLLFCIYIPRSKYLHQYHDRLKNYSIKFKFIILSCVVSGLIHHAVKIVLGRYRPRYLFSEEWYGLSPLNFNIAHNSFPSGHTQTIFAISMGLTILFPRFGIIFLLAAILVGFSRIILIAHYPSDVIFGAYLGLSTALLLKRYYLDKRSIDRLH